MAVLPRPKLTYEDYASFPDDGIRRELIDGEVHVTPSPVTRHQRIVLRPARLLADHVDDHHAGEVFVAPYDVVLSRHDVVQPDVVFVATLDAGIVTKANLQGPPTLVVEVVSRPPHRPGAQARPLRPPRGSRVVDRRPRRRPGGGPPPGGLVVPKPSILEAGDTLASPSFPHLSIDVAGLLAP